MVIMKVGERYHIKKKNGEPGKTSFASRKAAENAQKNLNKLKAANKKGSTKKKTPKKKTTKSKSSNKKGGHKTTKKRSWVTWARLGVYALAASAEAVRLVSFYGFTKMGAQRIGEAYTGREYGGKFSGDQAKQTYAPLAIVAVVDTIASKAGVYKRMSSL